MTNIISKNKIDNIVDKHKTKLNSETTQEELLEIIKEIVYESINSIEIKKINDGMYREINNGLRKIGMRL